MLMITTEHNQPQKQRFMIFYFISKLRNFIWKKIKKLNIKN